MIRRRKLALAALGVLGAVVFFGLGRFTADRPEPAHSTAGADYAAGLRAGRAQGVQEGRALQEGIALPAGTRDAATAAFTAGYLAGANDTFGGYDGGWAVGSPYVIVLEVGANGVTYRIASRTELQPGVSYTLCPDGKSLCPK